jgi:LysM repeat protein
MRILSTLLVSVSLTLALNPLSAAAETSGGQYVVEAGDTLSGIARSLGVPLGDLLVVNGLTVNSLIVPGQRLAVPTDGGSAGTGSGTSSHTVVAGDTLSGIASRYGVRLSALLAANGLTVSSLIVPGMRLTVPAPSSGGSSGSGGAPAAPSAGSYTVVAGDTLSGIATRHGVRLAALLAANGLTVSSLIVPGMSLQLPAAGGSGAGGAGGGGSGGGGSGPGSGGQVHTVVAGDSLSGIAARHGVGLSALLALNGLTVNSLIVPGMRLQLPADSSADSPPADQRVETAVAYALAQVGKPYRFAASGPWAFDCSGLTAAAFDRIGVSLYHQSSYQARQGRVVDFWSQPIRRGDLVFLDTTGNGVIDHVGIALSATRWVHATRPGDVVRVAAMPSLGKIVAVRRMVPSG